MLAVPDPTTRPHRNLLTLLVAVVAATGLLVGGCAADPASEPALNTSVTLPEGDVAAEQPGTSYVARPVAEGDIVFRAAPNTGAEVVATLPNPRPLATDPPVSIPLVLLVAEREGDWAKVYLPIRPNGSTGWIPADELTITTHPCHHFPGCIFLENKRWNINKNEKIPQNPSKK